MRWVHCLAPWQRAAFAVLVVCHLIAPIYVLWPRATNEHLAALQDALPLAQTSLLLTWLILGPRTCLSRAPAALWVAWLLWRQGSFEVADFKDVWESDKLCRVYYDATTQSEYSLALLILLIGTLAPGLAIIRLCGFSLRAEPIGLNPRHQFSIRILLLLTTAVAMALSVSGQLRDCSSAESEVPRALAVPAAAIAFAAAAIVSMRAALAPGLPMVRCLLALILCSGLGIGIAWLCHREQDCLLMASWLVGFGLMVSGTLLGLRACGYHLAASAEIVEPVFTTPKPRPVPVRAGCPHCLVLLEDT